MQAIYQVSKVKEENIVFDYLVPDMVLEEVLAIVEHDVVVLLLIPLVSVDKIHDIAVLEMRVAHIFIS